MRDWLEKKAIMADYLMRNAWESERGDTNFISIMILLGVALAVAGVFITFKDKIVGDVQVIIDGFTLGNTTGK